MTDTLLCEMTLIRLTTSFFRAFFLFNDTRLIIKSLSHSPSLFITVTLYRSHTRKWFSNVLQLQASNDFLENPCDAASYHDGIACLRNHLFNYIKLSSHVQIEHSKHLGSCSKHTQQSRLSVASFNLDSCRWLTTFEMFINVQHSIYNCKCWTYGKVYIECTWIRYWWRRHQV